MKFIQPAHWKPKGIDDLEPNAWNALKRQESTSVIAGPGSGKTEFLAQKAAYLLETGLCPPNKKILAISFKNDAAKNLADRVKERCSENVSNRFVSMTFDAFTKSLVDRFRMALPEQYRLSKRYEIAFPSFRQEKQLINSFRNNFNNAVNIYNFTQRLQNMNLFIGGVRIGDPKLQWLEEEFLRFWLNQQINSSDGISRVSFLALNRIAEFIISTNNHIRRSIRASYPFVFVDEFQDTTFAQYDFLSSVFKASNAEVTVVGDYKQRIMGWAGAKGDAFHQFEADFSALRYSLQLNHRSSPELVRVQHAIAQVIDHMVGEVQSSNNNLISGDAAWVWTSYTIDQEAAHLAQWISNDMKGKLLSPRSYAILVRQKPEDYVQPISYYLAQNGLSLRNESVKVGQTTLQDLLSEDLTMIICNLLRLGLGHRNPKAWRQLTSDIQLLRETSQDDEKALQRIERHLAKFIATLRLLMQQPPTLKSGRDVLERIIAFISVDHLRSTFSRYASGDLLEISLEAFKEYYTNCLETQRSWEGVLDEFEGTNHIPLMTIHKSKGLEFDTTIFMGIDDNAWWSYKTGDSEGLSTFFVALSRAKQRAIFSYCEQRGQRINIAEFYSLLASAGVQEYRI